MSGAAGPVCRLTGMVDMLSAAMAGEYYERVGIEPQKLLQMYLSMIAPARRHVQGRLMRMHESKSSMLSPIEQKPTEAPENQVSLKVGPLIVVEVEPDAPPLDRLPFYP